MIYLRSDDLLDKNGFENGDSLLPLLIGYQAFSPIDWLLPFHSEVLFRCVEKFLLPALPKQINVSRISNGCSPIFLDAVERRNVVRDIAVAVTLNQVIAVADETKEDMKFPELSRWGDLTP